MRNLLAVWCDEARVLIYVRVEWIMVDNNRWYDINKRRFN